MSRIITIAKLQNRSLAHLQCLYHQAQRDLAESAPDSPARRNALTSLEDINRAIGYARRHPQCRF